MSTWIDSGLLHMKKSWLLAFVYNSPLGFQLVEIDFVNRLQREARVVSN